MNLAHRQESTGTVHLICAYTKLSRPWTPEDTCVLHSKSCLVVAVTLRQEKSDFKKYFFFLICVVLHFYRLQYSELHLFLNPLANGNIQPHFHAPNFCHSEGSVSVDLFPFSSPGYLYTRANWIAGEGLSREHLEFPAPEMPGRGGKLEYANGVSQTWGQKVDIIHFASGQLFGCGAAPLLPWIVMQMEGGTGRQLDHGWSWKLGFVSWACSLARPLCVPAVLWDELYHLPAETLPSAPRHAQKLQLFGGGMLDSQGQCTGFCKAGWVTPLPVALLLPPTLISSMQWGKFCLKLATEM